MDLQIDAEDVLLLQRTLEHALGELRAEIAGTESFDWRQSMHRDEERLKSLLDRLAQLKNVT